MYSVNAFLKQATKEDLYVNGFLVTNKTFVIKNLGCTCFHSLYKIQSCAFDVETQTNHYWSISEVELLLYFNAIFKLVPCRDDNTEVAIKLYLKVAEEFDLLDMNELIYNKTYYKKAANNDLTGPFHITTADKLQDFLEMIFRGEILIPFEKQTFEIIKIAKAS